MLIIILDIDKTGVRKHTYLGIKWFIASNNEDEGNTIMLYIDVLMWFMVELIQN